MDAIVCYSFTHQSLPSDNSVHHQLGTEYQSRTRGTIQKTNLHTMGGCRPKPGGVIAIPYLPGSLSICNQGLSCFGAFASDTPI